MTDWIWIKSKQSGHQYRIPADTFDEKAHQRLKQEPRDEFGMPRSPEYATPSGSADSGQKATTPKKEND